MRLRNEIGYLLVGHTFYREIRIVEVKKALRRMKAIKARG